MRGTWRRHRSVAAKLATRGYREGSRLELADRSRIAVVGGGPGGSLFAYFTHKMAEVVGLDLHIDIYEPRSFERIGPTGCNNCGGIVSESLVQLLATEGILLPGSVIQRGIDSYCLHMDVGTATIETPLQEKRIAAVFRGSGPRNAHGIRWDSFDRFLLGLAERRGARVVPCAVRDIGRQDGRPVLGLDGERKESYDLVCVAVGVNSKLLKVLQAGSMAYDRPATVPAYICEFQLDHETVRRYLGSSMHVFLLDLPRLEFAALIPKGAVVTLCLLGDGIDADLVRRFLAAPEVAACFPPAAEGPAKVCHCSPKLNVGGPARPYADRVVFVGDSGVTRLYKDGIGAAYRTAKAAASTVVFQGVSAEAFERHFLPICRRIARDNAIGKTIFAFNGLLQKRRLSRNAILRMVTSEQTAPGSRRHMSQMLWDLFTGSAPYREILLRTMRPGFVGGLVWHTARGLVPSGRPPGVEEGVHGRPGAG